MNRYCIIPIGVGLSVAEQVLVNKCFGQFGYNIVYVEDLPMIYNARIIYLVINLVLAILPVFGL